MLSKSTQSTPDASAYRVTNMDCDSDLYVLNASWDMVTLNPCSAKSLASFFHSFEAGIADAISSDEKYLYV